MPGVVEGVGGVGEVEEEVGDVLTCEAGGEAAALEFPDEDVAAAVDEEGGWAAGLGEVDGGGGAVVFGGFFRGAGEVLAEEAGGVEDVVGVGVLPGEGHVGGGVEGDAGFDGGVVEAVGAGGGDLAAGGAAEESEVLAGEAEGGGVLFEVGEGGEHVFALGGPGVGGGEAIGDGGDSEALGGPVAGPVGEFFGGTAFPAAGVEDDEAGGGGRGEGGVEEDGERGRVGQGDFEALGGWGLGIRRGGGAGEVGGEVRGPGGGGDAEGGLEAGVQGAALLEHEEGGDEEEGEGRDGEQAGEAGERAAVEEAPQEKEGGEEGEAVAVFADGECGLPEGEGVEGDELGQGGEGAGESEEEAQPGHRREVRQLGADEDDGAFVFRDAAFALDGDGEFGGFGDIDDGFELDTGEAVGVDANDAGVDGFRFGGIDDPELVVFVGRDGGHFFEFEDALFFFAVPDDDGDALLEFGDGGLQRRDLHLGEGVALLEGLEFGGELGEGGFEGVCLLAGAGGGGFGDVGARLLEVGAGEEVVGVEAGGGFV